MWPLVVSTLMLKASNEYYWRGGGEGWGPHCTIFSRCHQKFPFLRCLSFRFLGTTQRQITLNNFYQVRQWESDNEKIRVTIKSSHKFRKSSKLLLTIVSNKPHYYLCYAKQAIWLVQKRQISIVLVTFGEYHQYHLLYWGLCLKLPIQVRNG